MTQAIAYDNGIVLDRSAGPTRTWANSVGMYLAGRSELDEVDRTAAEMEAKWGCDRLRLLVSPELREKFDRQRYLLNRALWHGTLDDVKREGPRTVTAYRALNKAATAAGAKTLDPEVWEVCLADGSVAALVQTAQDTWRVAPDGRRLQVYSLDEIAALLDGYPGLARVKAGFPGAGVTAVRRSVPDPLEALSDSRKPIDEPFADEEIPF